MRETYHMILRWKESECVFGQRRCDLCGIWVTVLG